MPGCTQRVYAISTVQTQMHRVQLPVNTVVHFVAAHTNIMQLYANILLPRFSQKNGVAQGHSSEREQRAELFGFGPGDPSIALYVIHGIRYALLADEGDREGFGAEEDEDEHEGEAVQHAQAGADAAKTGGTLRQVRRTLSSLRVCVAAAALLQCCSSCVTTMYVLRFL